MTGTESTSFGGGWNTNGWRETGLGGQVQTAK